MHDRCCMCCAHNTAPVMLHMHQTPHLHDAHEPPHAVHMTLYMHVVYYTHNTPHACGQHTALLTAPHTTSSSTGHMTFTHCTHTQPLFCPMWSHLVIVTFPSMGIYCTRKILFCYKTLQCKHSRVWLVVGVGFFFLFVLKLVYY